MFNADFRSIRWRRVAALLFAWLIIPLLILAGLELGLRATGYGVDTAPFRTLNTDRGKIYVCNIDYLYNMFSRRADIGRTNTEFAIPEQKEPDTYRIFVYGGSAAAGWIHRASFSQFLQVMLMKRFPGVRFEIYNLANGGLNSSIMRPLAQACADMHPDAYVIYMGNNEVHGPYGLITEYATHKGRVMTPLEIRFHQEMRRFRLGQWLDKTARERTSRSHTGSLSEELPPDDPRLSQVWRNFEYNLRDMFGSAATAQAEVFVSTLGANLRHWPPYPDLVWDTMTDAQQKELGEKIQEGKTLEGAEHWQEALDTYSQAEVVVKSSPYLYFRQANCYWALGKYDQARALYQKALELDSFRWVRAKGVFNDTIRQAVTDFAGDNVTLVEGQAAFEAAAPHATPGNESFADGCHMRPAGMYVLARAFYEQMLPKMPPWVRRHEDANGPVPQLTDILEMLGYSEHLDENTLEQLIQKSLEYGMDSTSALQKELDDIRAHPIPIDYNKQFSLLRKVVETGTEDILFAYKFFRCLGCTEHQGDDDIYVLSRKLAERYTYDPFLQYLYAEILRFKDKYAEMEVLYRNLIKNLPQDEQAYLDLTPLLLQRNALEEGRQILKEARSRHLPAGACHCIQGDLLRYEGDVAAIDAYIKALQEDSRLYSHVVDGLCDSLRQFPNEAAARAPVLLELTSVLFREYKDSGLAKILEALPGGQETLERYIEMISKSPAPDLSSMLEQVDIMLHTWNGADQPAEFWRKETLAHSESVLRWISLGCSLEREGDSEEAKTAFENALERDPYNACALYKLGLLEIGSGPFEQGIDRLVQAARNNTATAVFIAGECSKRATVSVEHGNLDAAINLYKAALCVFPADLWPQVYLGEIYEKQGNQSNALEAYRNVLMQKTESPVVAQKLQELLVKIQTPPETVLAEWEAINAADPESIVPLYYLGMAQERLGRLADARAAYMRVLDHNQEFDQVAYKLAALEILTGNMDQGLTKIQEIVQQHPDQAEGISAHLGELAKNFTGQGKMEEAILLYKSALEISPTDLWPQVYLGEIYEAQGNQDNALEAYRSVLMQKPESPVSAQKLQELLVKIQTPPEAILAEWQAISNSHPDAAVPLQYMGMAQEALGQIAEASSSYGKALTHNPKSGPAAWRLAALEIRAGNMDQGMTELREVAQNNPDQVSGIGNHLGELAEIFMGQGKVEEAIVLYKLAFELSPTDLRPQMHLGKIYETQGDYTNALAAYKNVLKQEPESPISAQKLQELLIKTQASPETVLAEWQAINALNPESALPLYYVGKALEATGDLKGAQEAIQHAQEIQPDITTILSGSDMAPR